jgi:DNA-binding LacI/PurR family transcriptional regulator
MGLKEIAERTGVSITTVSLVLSGKGRVSEAVRRKVLDTARELRYKSPLYEGVGERGDAVGILYHMDPEWAYAHGFLLPVLNALESVFAEAGRQTLVIPFYFDDDRGAILRKVERLGVAGIVSIHFADDKLFNRLENDGVPVVIVNNLTWFDEFTSIGVDDFQGAYRGGKHLLDLGHGDILFVDYKRERMSSIVEDRYYGFLKALNERGASSPKHERLTVVDQKGGELRTKLEKTLSGAWRPTAVFAHDDYLALHITHALGEIGVAVPEDISIIAPGDVLDYSEPFIPRISTMRIDTELMGRVTGEAMLKRLTGKEITRSYSLRIKQHLVERGSCLPPPSRRETA